MRWLTEEIFLTHLNRPSALVTPQKFKTKSPEHNALEQRFAEAAPNYFYDDRHIDCTTRRESALR